jgi:hypothetical protein
MMSAEPQKYAWSYKKEECTILFSNLILRIKLFQYLIIGNEVTERLVHKDYESERHLRQILDSMPQKITNADTEG